MTISTYLHTQQKSPQVFLSSLTSGLYENAEAFLVLCQKHIMELFCENK